MASTAIRNELMKFGRRYIEMARDLSSEDQVLMVRGMLIESVLMKTDKGVMSAKTLGADKRILMWTPDAQVGVVVLSPPPVPVIKTDCRILPEEPPTTSRRPSSVRQRLPRTAEVMLSPRTGSKLNYQTKRPRIGF